MVRICYMKRIGEVSRKRQDLFMDLGTQRGIPTHFSSKGNKVVRESEVEGPKKKRTDLAHGIDE